MLTDPQYHRLLVRITKSAQGETRALLKALPKDFKERLSSVPKVTIRFEDRQERDKYDHNAIPEPLSITRREPNEIVIYVMSIFERYGSEPGAFIGALRRVIIKELGDWVGIDASTDD